jgi:hypothetical protein
MFASAERAERSDPAKRERVIRLRACGATARQFAAGFVAGTIQTNPQTPWRGFPDPNLPHAVPAANDHEMCGVSGWGTGFRRMFGAD